MSGTATACLVRKEYKMPVHVGRLRDIQVVFPLSPACPTPPAPALGVYATAMSHSLGLQPCLHHTHTQKLEMLTVC